MKPAIVLDPDEETTTERRRLGPLTRGVAVLNPDDKMPSDLDEEIRQEGMAKGRRVQYSAMYAHMELAAMALATGCTIKQAAAYAGVGRDHIKKKYLPNPDFRARVAELHVQMTTQLKGRIIKELLRRTSGDNIQKMELLDILRIGDRVGLSRAEGSQREDENQEHRKYDVIFNQILVHAGPQGGDFPIYEPNRPALPGESSPVEG